MKRQRREVDPKPFVLINIPEEPPKRAQASTHERFRDLTGQLQLKITVESEYLFVGSGYYEFDPSERRDAPDVWYTFYRRNRQICIPGTSIKGAIRAIVEAISNSCVLHRSKQEQSRLDSAHRPCRFRDEKSSLCPACRLFGTTGFRGRLYFSDALPQGEVRAKTVKIAELWEPKRAASARRFYEVKRFQAISNQRPERNFRFVEAIPKGSQFRVSLQFENLNEAELGLVCHALGWKAENEKFGFAFTPKLGGAKPRCFGAVRFEPIQLHLWKGNILLSGLKPQALQGEESSRFLVECLQACQRSDFLHRRSWETLVRGLQPKNETCPREVY